MVKHVTNKKRRSGRTGKTSIKQRNNFTRWDPNLHKNIKNATVREHWDPSKSFTANLSAIGLVARPNDDVKNLNPPSQHQQQSIKDQGADVPNIVELFDIPDSDVLTQQNREKRCVLNEEDQIYIAKCMSKYGDDYTRAFRDIKINYMQHTETQIRKLGARFLLLSPEQRLVDIPEKVKALILVNDEA